MKATTTKKISIANVIKGNKNLSDEITRLQKLKKSIENIFKADVESICEKRTAQTKLICDYYKLNIANITNFIEIEIQHEKYLTDVEKCNKDFFESINASKSKHRELLTNIFRDKELIIEKYANYIGLSSNSKEATEIYNTIFKDIVNFWF